MDIYSKEKRSAIMANIKGKETLLETKAWLLLREAGIRFHRHPKSITGKPDAANKSKKLAIFIDSEFWHGYDWDRRKKNFKSNQAFWISKIEQNIKRDKEVNRMLRKKGWNVLRLWEGDLSSKKRKHTIARLKKSLF